MRMERLTGVWTIRLESIDANVGQIQHVAGEVLKIDVYHRGSTNLSIGFAAKPNDAPVASFTPVSHVDDWAEFRIADADVAAHVAEGDQLFFDIWSGPDSDPVRLAFGKVKRKPSIRTPTTPTDETTVVYEAGVYEAGVYV